MANLPGTVLATATSLQPDCTTTEEILHGGDLVARVFQQQGVQHLFTLCGGHISPILVCAKNRGIRIIDVRDEATAVFAADASARLR